MWGWGTRENSLHVGMGNRVRMAILTMYDWFVTALQVDIDTRHIGWVRCELIHSQQQTPCRLVKLELKGETQSMHHFIGH